MEDFMKSQTQKPSSFMELDVSVTCHTCFAHVYDAEYYPVERLLKWKCDDGHVSFVEDFKL